MYQLHELSPVIEAVEYWQDDPEKVLWLRQDAGRLRLSLSKPSKIAAKLQTVSNLADCERPDELTVFVQWPTGEHAVMTPSSWDDMAPLEGRPYVFGVYDCYTIVKDWMRKERGIVMDEMVETPDRVANLWMMDNVFFNKQESDRWRLVAKPQVGDVILFSVDRNGELGSRNVNHCGVFVGGGQFLHHFPNRLSCIEPLSERWKTWRVAYARRSEQ